MPCQHHVMSSLRALGLCTPLRACRVLLSPRFAAQRRLLSSQCLPKLRRTDFRQAWQRTQSRAATTAARKARSSFRYPAEINVYRVGALTTAFVGIIRGASFIVFAVGTILAFPLYTYRYLYPSPKTDDREEEVRWYLPLLLLFGSWIPLMVTIFALAPFVHTIHIALPTVARKSKEDLMRWASNIPGTTMISIGVMRFRHAPEVQRAAFEDLSRLPISYTRLSNLEIQPPPANARFLAKQNHSWTARFWERVARQLYGRFFVKRSLKVDKSAVPGVWGTIWEQIPNKGEEKVRTRQAEQKRSEVKPPGPRIKPRR